MEKTILNYPIAKQSTTVQGIFNTLKVITSAELKTAVQRGKVLIDGIPCDSPRSRIGEGQVLTYNDFEITVHIDEGAKSQRLLTEMMRNGGFKGNPLGGGGAGAGAVRK